MGFASQSIRFKTGLTFAMLAAVALVWALASYLVANTEGSAFERMNRAAQILRNHGDADMDHDAIRADVLNILVAQADPRVDAQAGARELRGRIAEFNGLMARTQKFDDAPAVRDAALALRGDIAAYLDAAETIARYAAANRPVPAAAMVQFTAKFETLEGGMAHVSDLIEAHSSATKAAAGSAQHRAMMVTLVCLALVCLAIYCAMRVIRRALLLPIIAVGNHLEALARGERDRTAPHAGQGDEIGALARCAETLRQQLTAAETMRQSQEQAIIASLGAGLARLAKGDLSARIEQQLEGSFACLKSDFNAAASGLGDALQVVRDASNGMLATSNEISAAVDDLSRRNEQQAASLQDITRSISSVTGQVAKAAEAVGSAQAAVGSVNAEVAQGGLVIQSAVAAMDRIENSSNEISQIITVIDGIAFQTNLLALNAGVEAARAGEAGKGFAVVANEVRALAQRSAEAANDIKQLILTSSGEVETGVKLVREAGASLEAITAGMGEIARVMQTVSSGASHQVGALRDIDGCAKSLEQITQSNAALAEQVSAATRAMVASTGQVDDELARFRHPAAAGGRQTFARAA